MLFSELSIISELEFALLLLFLLLISIPLIIIRKNRIIKEKSKRINAIKEIVDNIHKNFNIKNIKESSVQSIGSVLEADQCIIAEYNSNTKKFSNVNAEYLASSDEISLKGELPPIQATRVTNFCISNKILNIPNISKYISENYLQDTLIETFYDTYHIKSLLGVPIRHSGKVLGAIILYYTKKVKYFSSEDIQFVKGIADSIGVALYQSNLYEEQKKIARRDTLLREMTETIRVSLDINETKQIIVSEICKIFGADRCYLREYDPQENLFLMPEVEYLASPEIESLKGKEPNQQALSYFFKKIKATKDFNPIEITQEFFEESNINKPNLSDYFDKFGIKSDFAVPIWGKKEKLTFLVLHYIKEKVILSDEDKNLLTALAKQISIALEQSLLYNEIKIQAEREKKVKKIVSIIRSSLELDVILKNVATELLSCCGGIQRIFIGKISLADKKQFVEVTERPEIKKVSDVDDNDYNIVSNFWEDYIKKYKIKKIIPNIANSDIPDVIKNFYNALGVKSIIAIPVKSKEEIWGGLFLSSTDSYKKWNEDEIGYLESIVAQLNIAINQSELYEEQKKAVEREKVLRELVNMIRQSLDIKEIINSFVFKIGKMFEFQRTFFVKYDKEKDIFYTPSEFAEYIKSPDDRSFRDFGGNMSLAYPIFSKILSSAKKNIFFPDKETFIREYGLENTIDAENLRIDNAGTLLCVPIIYEENLLGIYVVSRKEPYSMSQDVVDYIETVAEQIAIGLYQAELLEKEKYSAQREILLRKIIEIIRSTIDIDFIKHEIVNQIGNFLKADRVAFADYDSRSDKYFTLESNEYRSSPSVKTFVGCDFSLIQGFAESIKEIHLKGQDIIFSDLNKYLEEKNLKNSGIEKFYKEIGVASSLAINIYHRNLFFGNLVITFEQERNITQDDIEFIKTITNQASIAIYQSTLYEKEKQTAQRESFLRRITETIRSSLDIKELKNSVVDSIGKALNADLCLLIEGNNLTGELSVLDKYSEYRASDDIPSFIDMDFEKESQIKFIKDKNKQMKELFIADSEKFIKENNLQGTLEEQFFQKTGIKTAFGLSLFYQNDFIGILGIYFIKELKYFSEEDKNFARVLAVQAGNALHQSKLYELQKKIAYKESVLKDIISTIKLTRDLNHAYHKLLKKLADIFNLNRTLFLESSKINPDELDVKYEYVISRKDLSVNNIVFPKVCVEQFLNLIHNLETLVIDDVTKCHPKEILSFFEKYKIQALLSVPLVKYNGETKVLGFIVLCSEEVRNWTNEEIDLIKVISDSVVSVIWEISKFLETEELRNSFVLTLAHDFQVPLVGERTAIEYLLNYSECSFGANQDILKEILENNQNITDLLDKFVNIYNYESGKKKLDLETVKLTDILNEAIFLSNVEFNAKKIKINVKKHKENYSIVVDKKEILKVFTVLINNAIIHSFENNDVIIDYYKKNNKIIISIHNFGKSIPVEIQEKLFNRYEMALAIERKIGAGTGLFLSKRIIEAHQGYIWFKTSTEKGTTFYISLPLEESNQAYLP